MTFQKIKCLFGRHRIVHKMSAYTLRIVHTFECKECGNLQDYFVESRTIFNDKHCFINNIDYSAFHAN